jgi:hypothetical protein
MKQTPRVILIEILVGLLAVLLASGGWLAWRLSQGPLDLEMFRPQIEQSLSRARDGQPVKLGSIALEWSTKSGRIEAVARDLAAYNETGQALFEAKRAVLSLDALSILIGRVKTEGLRLEEGTATVHRSAEGVWSLAGLVLLREPKPGARPFDPLRDLNWSTLATPIRAIVSAGSFEQMEFSGFRIDVVDDKTRSTWRADPASGSWTARRDGVSVALSMKLAGGAGANSVRVQLSSDGKVTEATGRLELDGVDPLILARMFGYKGDELTTDRPANASFSASATEAGGLTSAGLSISGVAGRFAAGRFETALNDVTLEAVYDPASRRVDLRQLDIDAERLQGRLSGTADLSRLMAGDLASPIPMTVAGENLVVNLGPMFETPWSFSALQVEGSLATDLKKADVSRIAATTGEFKAQGSGSIWIDDSTGSPRLGMKVAATGEGALTPAQLAGFWPVKLGAGARKWVQTAIPSGEVTKAAFTMDWPPGALSQGFLPDEYLTLDFEANNVTVRFLNDFPPVTSVSGAGQLRGNSLAIKVAGGRLGEWTADEGEVLIPRFHPKDGDITVTAAGHGGLREMMAVLDQSFLKVGQRYGLRINDMKGAGGVEVRISRPAYTDAPDGDVTYEIKGGVRDASAPNLAAGFGLTQTDLTYLVTKTGLEIKGVGRFGPAPVDFTWKETFGDPVGRSELSAQGTVTPDLLNAFGIAARNVMQGEAKMDLVATGRPDNFDAITANLDLTAAGLDIPEIGWTKKAGAPANGVFRYGADADGASASMDIRADGLELIGDARLDAKGGIQRADVERIYSRDRLDLRGALTRRTDGGFKVALTGPLFDARPWMDEVLSMSQGAPSGAQPAPAGNAGPVLEMGLSVGRLRLRDKEELRKADLSIEVDGRGPRSGRVRGEISAGNLLQLDIRPEGDGRRVTLKADDAGFGARVVLKTDYLTGGAIELDGVFDAKGGKARVTMSDVRIKQAPLLAQVLSLASLRGLTDVLSGEGVLFSRVEAPVTFENGRIMLPGLKASGPAMGLTARGWIAPRQGELSLDGVLVPSFGVNSALGGIPIIGDLFVSRQGEGIFAPTYSVRGTFSRARVSINPIAAVTPGVLRRIFEVPEEPPPVPADVPPVAPQGAAPVN